MTPLLAAVAAAPSLVSIDAVAEALTPDGLELSLSLGWLTSAQKVSLKHPKEGLHDVQVELQGSLVRLLRGSRIIARWQNFIGMSFAQLTMLKFLTMTCFVVHFMGCGWAYIGLNWEPTPGQTLEWEESWLVHFCFDKLESNQEKLTQCEKSLSDYLDAKKRGFPRFYFTPQVDPRRPPREPPPANYSTLSS